MSLMSLPRFKHITVTWRVALESWKCLCGDLERAYLNYCEVLEALECLFHVPSAGEQKTFSLLCCLWFCFTLLFFFFLKCSSEGLRPV